MRLTPPEFEIHLQELFLFLFAIFADIKDFAKMSEKTATVVLIVATFMMSCCFGELPVLALMLMSPAYFLYVRSNSCDDAPEYPNDHPVVLAVKKIVPKRSQWRTIHAITHLLVTNKKDTVWAKKVFDEGDFSHAYLFRNHLTKLLSGDDLLGLAWFVTTTLALHIFMALFRSMVFADSPSVIHKCASVEDQLTAWVSSNDTYSNDCRWHHGSVSQLFVNHPHAITTVYGIVTFTVRHALLKTSCHFYVAEKYEALLKALIVAFIFIFHTWREGDLFAPRSDIAEERKNLHNLLVVVLATVAGACWCWRWKFVLQRDVAKRESVAHFSFIISTAFFGFVFFFFGWNLEGRGQTIRAILRMTGYARGFLGFLVILFVCLGEAKRSNWRIQSACFALAGLFLNLCLVNYACKDDELMYNWGFIFEANALFATIF